MFGYIRPLRSELKMRDYDRYYSAYCGLCRALGKRYGLCARFMVNYDLTFLYLLLASAEQPCECGKCICPANVFCKKQYDKNDAIYNFVTDIDVILCGFKLRDNISDASFFGSIKFRIAALLTGGSFRKAKKRRPEFAALTHERLARLSKLEEQKSADIDETADAFASLLSGCAAYFETEQLRRPAEQVLYHVGRFLYLIDALDDLKKDVKTDSYNPLRYRFSVTDGALDEADLRYFQELLDHSVSLAGAAFELLPGQSGRAILENTIYLGMPTVLRQVSDGSFRTHDKL